MDNLILKGGRFIQHTLTPDCIDIDKVNKFLVDERNVHCINGELIRALDPNNHIIDEILANYGSLILQDKSVLGRRISEKNVKKIFDFALGNKLNYISEDEPYFIFNKRLKPPIILMKHLAIFKTKDF